MTHYDKRKYICQYNIAPTKLRVRFDFFSRPVATLDDGKLVQYDGAIMMAKTQITLETEMQRRARQRANDLGVSLAEYFRRLVARDLARPETAARVDRIFDLGSSGGSDIASQKDSMIAEAFHSTRRKLRRR
ncbi:MAG: hypothetical protein DMG55_03500 [Acidobacteria bacterium]|nr:MAG: hypothetical protein DMG55_03500 [Acidobacteriota bacterium]